jgi:hypothetical protein
MNANEALRRIRMLHQGSVLAEAMITLINAAIENHSHPGWKVGDTDVVTILGNNYPFPSDPFQVSGSHEEPSEAAPGREHTGSHIEAGEREGRGIHAVIPSTPVQTRPGKSVPTAEQVCEMVAEMLTRAGVPGYASLSVAEGVERLITELRRTREHLLTAQASARQHLEASSHRAQIAEHYRTALLQVVEGPAESWPVWRGVARDALQVPEWDGKIRP